MAQVKWMVETDLYAYPPDKILGPGANKYELCVGGYDVTFSKKGFCGMTCSSPYVLPLEKITSVDICSPQYSEKGLVIQVPPHPARASACMAASCSCPRRWACAGVK